MALLVSVTLASGTDAPEGICHESRDFTLSNLRVDDTTKRQK